MELDTDLETVTRIFGNLAEYGERGIESYRDGFLIVRDGSDTAASVRQKGCYH